MYELNKHKLPDSVTMNYYYKTAKLELINFCETKRYLYITICHRIY